MHVDVMSAKLVDFLLECGHLAVKKNRDYHPDGVAYLEILQTAFESGITVEQDLWGRFRKQTSALRRYVIDGRVESETPRERMRDIANYMAILAVWVDHRSEILISTFDFVRVNRTCEAEVRSEAYNQPGRCPCDRCQFVWWLGKSCAAST
jgi:hypothetical protein